MQCPACQHGTPLNQKFCGECGTPLARLEGAADPRLSYADLERALRVALEQQSATSEILRTISRSPTDVQPVFQTLLDSAKHLLGAFSVTVAQRVGDELHLAALSSVSEAGDEKVREAFPFRMKEASPGGPIEPMVTAIFSLRPFVVSDAQTQPDIAEVQREVARARGFRSQLVVPLLREHTAIGAISVTRREAGGFTQAEVALLQTFASQAVIAIENVRLFKELEAANRELGAASRHKSEFLANMSHELRTPLNAVIGFSEVLLQRMFGELNAKQDEYLKDIYASGQHLLSLINDILDLSKIEAGRMELTPAPFHLPTILENGLTLVRERAARHGIALKLEVDPELGELVGDERKVKQVVLNLLSNAVKFTPAEGRIVLKAWRRDGLVEIAVTDTGIGIAPGDQAAIFEEFRQVGSDETRKQEGTGLGLTLAKKFIELHGGRIWVESEPGRGSTFTFTLPMA